MTHACTGYRVTHQRIASTVVSIGRIEPHEEYRTGRVIKAGLTAARVPGTVRELCSLP